MSKKLITGIIIFLIVISGVSVFLVHRKLFEENETDVLEQGKRLDGAIRITNCSGKQSCQNPCFSPDSKYIMFTRFKNGYNKGPSELVQIKTDGTEETVIVSAQDSDNVIVPYGSWVGNKICFASDRHGGADEIYIANDDGSNIQQITNHSERGGYYIEPVFNPTNTNKIIFEYAPSDGGSHHIAVVEIDKGNRVTFLTSNPNCDDRLPSWSRGGERILFQRADTGKDNWQIYVADIELEPELTLENLMRISPGGSHDTDNSWAYNDRYILSSSNYGDLSVPNIYAFSVNGSGKPVRITFSSTHEDGAPSYSPDGKWIAFESHKGQAENTPSEIWIIQAPKLEKSSLENITSYANVYQDYTNEDLEKLKRFDIVGIEPYYVPNKQFLSELKSSGTIVLAYVSIGEADDGRRYWVDWEPTDKTPDNSEIPRTTVTTDDPMFIGGDPGWEGSYFVDASNQKWHDIILNEEIPYILWLGGGQYDGLMMDLVDVVDEYEGLSNEDKMRQGMIDLIKKIRDEYPYLLLVPNRGFGILQDMASNIDAFKFEEMTGAYGNIKGEEHYGAYYLKIDEEGNRENQEEIDLLVSVLQDYPMPVLVLDHVQSNPPDEKVARKCFDEAQYLSNETGYRFIWYGNSVDQDLPIWSFLPFRM
ncbi:MAG: endo alpha-1,4 polygalactosaminidase [Candidatus Thermoplasmatota archaeon]